MENERIREINDQIMTLKSKNPEVYSWIMLKEKQKLLESQLSSDDLIDNRSEKQKELQEAEDEIKYMKEKYSSVSLYDALISVKQNMLEKLKDISDK